MAIELFMQRAIGIFLCIILLGFLLRDSISMSLQKDVNNSYVLADTEKGAAEEDNDSGRFFEEEFIVMPAKNVHIYKKIQKGSFFFEENLTDVHITLHYPPPNC